MGIGAPQLRQAFRNTASGLTAGGYTLLDARTVVGYNIQVDSDEWMLNLQTAGPYMLIMPHRGFDFEPRTFHADYKIKAYLWFGFDRDSNTDFENIEALVDFIKDTWGNLTALPAQGVGSPWEVNVAPEITNPDVQPAIALYTFEINMGGA